MFQSQEGMAQQSRQFHWDKRKRQYIQLQPGEKVKAGKRLKTESGASVAAKKGPSGLYKKWSKAHQTRIAPVGQMEDEKAGDSSGLADRSGSVSFRLASPPCGPCPHSFRSWSSNCPAHHVLRLTVSFERLQVPEWRQGMEKPNEAEAFGGEGSKGRAESPCTGVSLSSVLNIILWQSRVQSHFECGQQSKHLLCIYNLFLHFR